MNERFEEDHNMSLSAEKAALDQWYCIEALQDIAVGSSANRLLGVDLVVRRDAAGHIVPTIGGDDTPLPTRQRYGYLWTTLGAPATDLLPIPDVDEVWATNCQFFQPQAALSATGGIMTQYMYRVANPFATILYKTCPNAANRWDVICLFVQPLDPDRCRAHPVMFLIDDVSPLTDLIHFQQLIFLQDRIILENQRPALLPLEPRAEIPTRADASSIAYRRWLKEKGIIYGTTVQAA